MTPEKYEQMAQAIENYTKDKGISQNQLAQKIGIAPSYITHALKRNWVMVPAGTNADKTPRYTTFSENVATKIMLFFGLEQNVWEIENYMTVMNVLIEAKKHKEHRIIDGKTGSGKTFSCVAFKKQYPSETYLITCSEDMNPKSFMVELGRLVGVDTSGSRRKIRILISEKLKKQTNPLIIIDEAENLKNSTYGSIKALHDDVWEYAAIVLVGANNYLATLKKKAMAGKGCFPQLYSRFSADPAMLGDMSMRDVSMICTMNGINDRDKMKMLFDTCGDYRELDRTIKRILRDNEL